MTTKRMKGNNSKVKRNLNLDVDALAKGEEMAEKDRRSLSNFTEVLFEAEFARRHSGQSVPAEAEAVGEGKVAA